MNTQIICLKYKIKDCLKGWSYTGIYPIAETGPDMTDSEEEIKRKVKTLITKKNLMLTNSLYMVLTISPLRTMGLIPLEKSFSKSHTNTYKLDVASHLGLAHYAVAGTSYILESLDIAVYDKDNYVLLKPNN